MISIIKFVEKLKIFQLERALSFAKLFKEGFGEIVMNKYKRAILKRYYKLLYMFSPELYKKKYPMFLRNIGISISESFYSTKHGFIHPSVSFDFNDYSLIEIGDATTISSEVIFLTHDYSISKGLKLIHPSLSGRFLRPIIIGSNSFIGMRTIILPGTRIGSNVIVGAGSIVKGTIPDNVIIAGNPAKILSSTEEWAKRHYGANDFDYI